MSRRENDPADFCSRLKLVLADVGDDRSVVATGKSLRQLKRYAAGDEPPFSVLRSLVEEAGITFDWLTFGEASSSKDHSLSILFRQSEIKALKASLSKTTDVDQAATIKEMIGVNLKQIELSEQIIALRRQVGDQARSAILDRDTASEEELVRLSGESVVRVYREEGVRLPVVALPSEISRFFSKLSAQATDVATGADLRQRLLSIESELRRELQEVVENPGTGKLSA